MLFVLTSLFALPVYAGTWTETTFADFADGGFDAGGNIFASPDLPAALAAQAGGKLTLTGQQWDLNNDGFLDIVFSNNHDDTWSYNINSVIYWGSASGFTSGNKTELPTHGAYDNSVADLNGDGFLDIVFSNGYDGTSRNINSVIYWGSASGFSSDNKTELPTIGAKGNSVADLNGDGFLDIVFSNHYDGTSLNINSVVYWGSASGFTSGNKTELPTHGTECNSVADLNGDGFLDIVFNNNGDGASPNINSIIYWGSASGFSSDNKAELPTHGACGNSVADLNGDGFLDIVFSNNYDGTSRNINSVIYWGSASGFSSANKTELPTIGAIGNSVADLNGDGFLDIVFSNASNTSSYIYWGSASGFSSANKTELPTFACGNSVADLNGDGFLDIVFSNHYDGTSFNINSVIYWGSASGFSSDNKMELPTHGAAYSTTKDLGDAYTRLPEFVYVSSAYDTGAASNFGSISWVAQTPEGTYVQFQIRTADTQEALTEALWYGPTGTSNRYTVSGTSINPIHSGGRWVQYRVFLGTNYANAPILDSVTIDYTGGVPAYYAVIAGVADYPGTGNDLQYPDDDAIDIKNSLLLYSNWLDDNIQLLLDSEANKSNIKTAIEKMGSMADADDVCLLFFSGHGTNGTDVAPIDESDGLDEYICSYGSSLDEFIRDDELSDWLAALPTTNVVVIVDTCYSGGQIKVVDGFTPKVLPGTTGVVQKGDGFATDITRRIHVEDMDDNEGCVVLAACDDDELSRELGLLKNGLFTYFVVKGLEKNVDKNGNGELSAEETGKYAKSIVNLLNKFLPFLKQHPQLYDDYPAGMPQSDELSVCIGEPQPVAAIHDKDIENIIGLAAPTVVAVPKSSKLLQNYSNPFNPDTWIPYQLSEGADVTIRIYNVAGQLVRILDLGHKQAGFYLSKDKAAYWDGKNEAGEALSSGVYFYQLQAGDFTATGKMLMVK
jgi:hypothetical protein